MMGLLCVKCSFLLLLSLLSLASLASVGLGAWLLSDSAFTDALALSNQATQDAMLQSSIALFISCGVLTTLLVLLACQGAVQSSRCILRLFIFFVILVCVLQLIAVAMTGSYRNNSVPSLPASLLASLTPDQFYSDGKTTDFGRLVNVVQHRLECCGMNNSADYDHNGFSLHNETRDFPYPYSCCALIRAADEADPGPEDVLNIEACESLLPTYFHSEGCSSRLVASLDYLSWILLLFEVHVLCLQLLSIVFAVLLWRAITKDYYY